MTQTKKSFREYLVKKDILCNVKEQDGLKVLQQLLQQLQNTFPELDVEQAAEAVLKREEVFPTVVAPGLAIPHARLANLSHPLVAVACSPEGMDFPTPDIKVSVMVVLLTPLDEPNLHLQIISALAQFFANPDAIVNAAQMKDAESLLSFFDPEQTGIPEYLTAQDIMINIEPLHTEDSISSVLERLATSRFLELPVVDQEGHLKGEISMADLLRYCIPSYFQCVEDLSCISKFEPLADFLNRASDTRVIDVMRGNSFRAVSPKTPVAQLALDFIKDKVSQIEIVDKEKKLLGVVELRSFCAKFFWE